MHGITTPWGVADQVRIVAPGIVWCETPSHGGYWLSKERLAQMDPALRSFRPFTGKAAWFEEDCDWAVVVVAFPTFFDPPAVEAAVRAIQDSDYYTRAGLDRERLCASAVWEATTHELARWAQLGEYVLLAGDEKPSKGGGT